MFDRVAELVGDPEIDGVQLRSDVLSAIRTSWAYLYENAYADLAGGALALTQGDIDLNIDELASSPVTQDPPVTPQ